MNLKYLSALFFFFFIVSAQSLLSQDVVRYNFPIYFDGGSADIDLTYQNNRASVDSIIGLLNRMNGDSPSYSLRKVELVGGTSPVGKVIDNERLSRTRALALNRYLLSRVKLPYLHFSICALGEDWVGLRRMVVDSQIEAKSEVLRIIDEVPLFGGREYQLMNLRGGVPYRQMMKRFFPKLQKVSCVFEVVSSEVNYVQEVRIHKTPTDVDSDNDNDNESEGVVFPKTNQVKSDTQPTDTMTHSTCVSASAKVNGGSSSPQSLSRWNLSANLLYWVALIPNIGLEYCLPNGRWSVNGEYSSPLWKYGGNMQKYYQIWQGSLESRFWFCHDHLFTRHFLGLYANGGYFDLTRNTRCYEGNFVGGGLSYGYVWPCSSSWRIELSIAAGYFTSKYDEKVFFNSNMEYVKTMRVGYLGPTKAKIALVWNFITR